MSGCNMANLVEADHDGRLGSREKASVARHLGSCAECRDHAKDLERMRALAKGERAPVQPLAHQRGRVRLLQEAALEPRPVRRAPIRLVATLAAAMIGAVAMAAVVTHRPEAPRATGAVRAGVTALNLTVVGADPGTSFERTRDQGLDLVTLAAGTVHLKVHHLHAGERFVVRTEDAEVEVRGTRFDVEAEAGHITRVHVSEGVVELRRGADKRLLPAGSEWTAPPAAPVARSTDPTSAASPEAVTAPQAVSAKSPPAAGAGPSGEPLPASDDDAAFRAGMSRLEKGDFGQAAKDLSTFAASHPDDPRAEDAAFLEALSLSRAGRTDDAAAAARRYLDRYPQGYRRREAEKLLAP